MQSKSNSRAPLARLFMSGAAVVVAVAAGATIGGASAGRPDRASQLDLRAPARGRAEAPLWKVVPMTTCNSDGTICFDRLPPVRTGERWEIQSVSCAFDKAPGGSFRHLSLQVTDHSVTELFGDRVLAPKGKASRRETTVRLGSRRMALPIEPGSTVHLTAVSSGGMDGGECKVSGVRQKLGRSKPGFGASKAARREAPGAQRRAAVDGTRGNDILSGTSDPDILKGLGGSDQLFGLGGEDQLFGGGRGDSLGGGSGVDFLSGDAGADILGGGRDADTLIGGPGIDSASYVGALGGVSVNLATGHGLAGDAAGDTLFEIENVIGTTFDDFLVGNDSGNSLSGGNGIDVLDGAGGDDQLDGGAGQDVLDGGAGTDTVAHSTATESVGVNLLVNSGDDGDTLAGIENVDGSDFRDLLFGDNRDNRLRGFDGDDRLEGKIGRDSLDGGAGGDILLGGPSDDFMIGGAGADVIGGGLNVDTLSYAASTSGVVASLRTGNGDQGDAEGDKMSEVENLIGSNDEDVLEGDSGPNVLMGLDRLDQLFAYEGDDIVIGGRDADFLIGDAGNDRFDFTAPTDGGDSIADFSSSPGNDDRLGFAGGAFGNLPAGPLAADRFVANVSGVATSREQRFVYETDIGILFYDANGSRPGGVTVMLGLPGAPTLTAADIEIF